MLPGPIPEARLVEGSSMRWSHEGRGARLGPMEFGHADGTHLQPALGVFKECGAVTLGVTAQDVGANRPPTLFVAVLVVRPAQCTPWFSIYTYHTERVLLSRVSAWDAP